MFGCLRAYLISLLSLDFFSSLCPLLRSVGQSLVLRVPSLSHSSDFWSLYTALIFNGNLFLISTSLLQMFRFPSETQHSKTQTYFTPQTVVLPILPLSVGGNPAILCHQVDLLFFSPSWNQSLNPTNFSFIGFLEFVPFPVPLSSSKDYLSPCLLNTLVTA